MRNKKANISCDALHEPQTSISNQKWTLFPKVDIFNVSILERTFLHS